MNNGKLEPYEVDAAKAFNFNYKRFKGLDPDEQNAALDSIEMGVKMGAFTDPLTGLDNRAGLNVRIDQLCKTILRGENPANSEIGIAVYFIDVNRLKTINDNYGHNAGDELLKGIAKVLKDASQRPEDVVGRVSGDEFVFAGERRLPTPDDQDEIIQRIFTGMESFRLEFEEKYPNLPEGTVTLSIGRALFTLTEINILIRDNHDIDLIDLILPNADDSMYEAKEGAHITNGNAFIRFFRVSSRIGKPLSPVPLLQGQE